MNRFEGGLALAAQAVSGLVVSIAAAQGGPSPVRVDPVTEQQTVEHRMVTGDLVAMHRSAVAAREPGLVLQVGVDVGHEVAGGDVLVQLDDSRLVIMLQEAEAQQRVAEARKAQRAALLEQAKRDEQLVRTSFDRGAANPKELLDAETTVATTQADLDEATQEVAVAEARISLLRKRIADMSIQAPFSGIVVTRYAEPGQWIREGDPVVELISTGVLEAWLSVPQRLLSQVRSLQQSRQPLTIQIGDELVEGRFDRVVADIHPTARQFKLIVTVPNDDGLLAPGMAISGWLPTRERSLHLTAHKDAVMRNDAGPFVFAVRPGRDGESTVAAPVQIRILYPQGERYVIAADGLADGDEVVVEGNERLFPYSPITPVREQPTAQPNRSSGADS